MHNWASNGAHFLFKGRDASEVMIWTLRWRDAHEIIGMNTRILTQRLYDEALENEGSSELSELTIRG